MAKLYRPDSVGDWVTSHCAGHWSCSRRQLGAAGPKLSKGVYSKGKEILKTSMIVCMYACMGVCVKLKQSYNLESFIRNPGRSCASKPKPKGSECDLKSSRNKMHLSKTISPTENRTFHIMRQSRIRGLKITSGVFGQAFKRPFSPQTSAEHTLCIYSAGSPGEWQSVPATLFP